jgi:hypothetical protein
VVADGLGLDPEPVRDLRGGVAMIEQVEHVELTRRDGPDQRRGSELRSDRLDQAEDSDDPVVGSLDHDRADLDRHMHAVWPRRLGEARWIAAARPVSGT